MIENRMGFRFVSWEGLRGMMAVADVCSRKSRINQC